MKSILDGKSYTHIHQFSADHPKGMWKILVARKGKEWFLGDEEAVWVGAEGEVKLDNGEPPQAVRDALVALLGYDKAPTPKHAVNLVEMVADQEDCAFDQPCAHGFRVEDHAVY